MLQAYLLPLRFPVELIVNKLSQKCSLCADQANKRQTRITTVSVNEKTKPEQILSKRTRIGRSRFFPFWILVLLWPTGRSTVPSSACLQLLPLFLSANQHIEFTTINKDKISRKVFVLWKTGTDKGKFLGQIVVKTSTKRKTLWLLPWVESIRGQGRVLVLQTGRKKNQWRKVLTAFSHCPFFSFFTISKKRNLTNLLPESPVGHVYNWVCLLFTSVLFVWPGQSRSCALFFVQSHWCMLPKITVLFSCADVRRRFSSRSWEGQRKSSSAHQLLMKCWKLESSLVFLIFLGSSSIVGHIICGYSVLPVLWFLHVSTVSKQTEVLTLNQTPCAQLPSYSQVMRHLTPGPATGKLPRTSLQFSYIFSFLGATTSTEWGAPRLPNLKLAPDFQWNPCPDKMFESVE